MTVDATEFYNNEALRLSQLYESLSPDNLYAKVTRYFPQTGKALDIGSGSGRDAAWLYQKGYTVTAIDPSIEMLRLAKENHPENIEWINDSLPLLSSINDASNKFDIILINAVWMHLKPSDRPAAFERIYQLLQQGGVLIITLRQGPLDSQRAMYDVTVDEIMMYAQTYNLEVIFQTDSDDRLERIEISWKTIAIKRPALPLKLRGR